MVDPLNTPQEGRYQQVAADQEREQSGLFTKIAAGLGVIALGQFIYRGSKGGNLIADILHYTGNVLRGKGVELRNAANKGASRISSSLSAGSRTIEDATIDVRTGGLRITDLSVTKDVVYSVRVIGASSSGEQVGALTELVKDALSARYKKSNVVSFFGHKFERLTIGEVLNDQERFQKVIGSNTWGILDKANKKGLLDKSWVIDPRIYKTASGIRDTRLKPLALGILDNFDFLGLSKVVKSALFGADSRFAVLPGGPGKSLQYFIDGGIYSFSRSDRGTLSVSKKAGKFLLRESGDPLQVSSTLRQGKSYVEDPAPSSFFNRLQASLGIGPAYRNRDPLFSTLFTSPYKRLKAIDDGSGVIYRREFVKETSSAAEAAFGDIAPEAFGAARYRRTTGNRTEQFKDLGLLDRLKVTFGIHDELAVLKRASYEDSKYIGKVLKNDDLVVPHPTGGLKDVDTFFATGSSGEITDAAVSYTGAGAESKLLKSTFYTAKDSITSRVLDFANYTITRLNSLASGSIAGVGFKVSGSIPTNIARLAAIPVAYAAAKEAIGYADYLIEDITGFSPIKAAAKTYGALRVGQQKLREAVGIQQASSTLERDFPGSINSELGFFGRSLLAPLGILMKGLKGGLGLKSSGLLAGLFEVLFGGPSPDQPAAELQQEYEGVRKVPVNRGAFWGMGYQPFFGGEASYYDYNPIYKTTTDYRTKSLYGSRQEYYSKHANVFGIPFPTPSNLFGLNNLLDPYALEKRHYFDRPYSQTAGMFDEFPVVGPLLSATIGEILKPRKKMHVSELYGLTTQSASLTDRYMPANAAQRLGMDDIPISEILMQDQNDPLVRLRQQAAIASEPLGIYKFIMEYMGVDLGYSRPGDQADAMLMGSLGNEFYNSNIAGLFGQTEFIRRFLLSERYTPSKQRQLINGSRNSMPTWLPGAGSETDSDQDYFLNFLQGDPYGKLEAGEARLPGPGYEALNPLYSNTPGVYSDVDKFLILSDVAPYSAAYSQYLTKIGSPTPDRYGDYWATKLQLAINQRDTIVNQLSSYPRLTDGVNDLNQFTKENGFYRAARAGWDTLTHDVLAEIPYFGSKFAPFRNPIERYEKEQIYGDNFADWNRPWETIVRPAIYDAARANPLAGAAKGAVIGALASNAMPGLGGALFNPIVATRMPSLAIPLFAAVGGSLSAARSIITDNVFVPPHRQSEIEAENYMDRLVYAKARSYEISARELGDSELANSYARMAGGTLVGARDSKSVKAALNPFDRKYFDSFLNTNVNNRNDLLYRLPTYYAEALQKSWNGDFNSIEENDSQTLDYFSSHALLDQSSLLWHPSVPVDAMKIKMIEGGINGVSDNLHRFGFYEGQGIEANARFPNIHYDGPKIINLPNLHSLKNTVLLKLRGLNPFIKDPNEVSIRNIHDSQFNNTYQINQKVDRSREMFTYMSDTLR